jgi:hypothetical protein
VLGCSAVNELLSAFVIPAPLASEASKRDQAGTQTTSPFALGTDCSRDERRIWL